jgi:dolichol-phosphate mannosyltransferase
MTSENRVISVEKLNGSPRHGILIVTPTYNEKGNLAAFMSGAGRSGADLLIVDDASPDGTAGTARELAAGYPGEAWLMRRRGKLGLGTAYADAFAWVLRERPDVTVVVQMDADASHDPAAIADLVAAARASGVGIGSRYVAGGSTPDWPLVRRLLSHYANVYARLVLGLRYHGFALRDATAGYVAWRMDAFRKVFSRPIMSNGYAFQVETKLKALLAGYVPKETPIAFHDRRWGASKMGFGVIWEAVIMPWRISVR